ncbi:MAG: hypothetical protein ACT4OE_05545 [Sphingosinicella sp.]
MAMATAAAAVAVEAIVIVILETPVVEGKPQPVANPVDAELKDAEFPVRQAVAPEAVVEKIDPVDFGDEAVRLAPRNCAALGGAPDPQVQILDLSVDIAALEERAAPELRLGGSGNCDKRGNGQGGSH